MKININILGVAIFIKKHRRSPSHFNLKYGRENSPPESPSKEYKPLINPTQEVECIKDGLEVGKYCIIIVISYASYLNKNVKFYHLSKTG